MTDELIRRCQAGERAALHELVDTYGALIQKVSFRITRDAEKRPWYWYLDGNPISFGMGRRAPV